MQEHFGLVGGTACIHFGGVTRTDHQAGVDDHTGMLGRDDALPECVERGRVGLDKCGRETHLLFDLVLAQPQEKCELGAERAVGVLACRARFGQCDGVGLCDRGGHGGDLADRSDSGFAGW